MSSPSTSSAAVLGFLLLHRHSSCLVPPFTIYDHTGYLMLKGNHVSEIKKERKNDGIKEGSKELCIIFVCMLCIHIFIKGAHMISICTKKMKELIDKDRKTERNLIFIYLSCVQLLFLFICGCCCCFPFSK